MKASNIGIPKQAPRGPAPDLEEAMEEEDDGTIETPEADDDAQDLKKDKLIKAKAKPAKKAAKKTKDEDDEDGEEPKPKKGRGKAKTAAAKGKGKK